MEQEEDDFDDERDGEEGEEEEKSGNEEEDGEEEGEGEEENGDGQNDNNDAEMETLEKEYMNLRHREQNILKNLKRHKEKDLLKGQAVKKQKALWDKALVFRFLLQKAFSSSNRLLQALLEKNPSIVQATDIKFEQSKKSQSSKNIDSDDGGDEDWSWISQLLSRYSDNNLDILGRRIIFYYLHMLLLY